MPVIKPRTRGKRLATKHRTRLERENTETLFAYAEFLGESTEYVLTQVIDTVLARDKEFVQWRTAHPGSFVPRPHDLRKAGRRPSPKPTAASVSAQPARRRWAMLRALVEARRVVALGVAGDVGAWGLSMYRSRRPTRSWASSRWKPQACAACWPTATPRSGSRLLFSAASL